MASKTRSNAENFLLGFMFLGLALGIWKGHWATGAAIGLGVGFLARFIVLYKHTSSSFEKYNLLKSLFVPFMFIGGGIGFLLHKTFWYGAMGIALGWLVTALIFVANKDQYHFVKYMKNFIWIVLGLSVLYITKNMSFFNIALAITLILGIFYILRGSWFEIGNGKNKK
ncbi:hypothetical protein [Aureibacter tunicatorum]|uniref:Magnesium-transporting ATPase (P-type) n=1 Tax=Aureibacter tunicatorum TaxID=866807 RepID=A0AAE3XJK6_9BACT|nr:hypothetical protein [Aureibacter tunicatorum]MDR6237577.1 magnesium-transporting ATPase (P-type) [Aureibacter tunicatorum]BDD02611.1 hypothetical protein AUTU_00940 [Aureibacter tunicatorum]